MDLAWTTDSVRQGALAAALPHRLGIDGRASAGHHMRSNRSIVAVGDRATELRARPRGTATARPRTRHHAEREHERPLLAAAHAGALALGSMIAVNVAELFTPVSLRTSPVNFPNRPMRCAVTSMVSTSPGTAGARNFASEMPMK